MARRSVTTLEETKAFAKELADTLRPGDVVCFFGGLGAGKTTTIKHLIHFLGDVPEDEITSPTYTYCNSYDALHHFDLYRLSHEKQFYALGFDEYFSPDAICFIEWAERIEKCIPENAHRIKITIDHNSRIIDYEAPALSNS